MKFTLYSLNDWLDGDDELARQREEYLHALYGQPPKDAKKTLEVEVPDRRRLSRMNIDLLQSAAFIFVVLFLLIVLLGFRK